MEKTKEISRKLHDRLRRKAVLFEESNQQYIVLIPCDGNKGWYEMGDVSALLYKYEICDKIGVETSVKDDFDTYYNQYKIGRIRTQHPETVVEHVKRAELFGEQATKEHCVFIKLKQEYSEEEVEKLKEEEKQRQAEINEIVKTKTIDPALKIKLTELAMRLHRICLRKLDKVSRDTNGARVVERCDKALMAYYYLASPVKVDAQTMLIMWQKLKDHVFAIEVELQIMVDLKIWKRVQVMDLAEMVLEVEERVDAHIAKQMAKVKKSKSKK